MRIGIDFGTTRIVVAAADRGNYPLVNFETPDGRIHDWFPSVVAVSKSKRLYGWSALDKQGSSDWTIVRSLKRLLNGAGPSSEIEIAGERFTVQQLLTEMMQTLNRELVESSTLRTTRYEKLEAVLGVPANANSNQRFLTQEIARNAGFVVLGLLNEPTAAAVEFAYRHGGDRRSRLKGGLLVYDLGGGTFDVTLVEFRNSEYWIVASDGISEFGGDDFDEILALHALATAGRPAANEDSLSPSEWYLLFDECREKKESLHVNSRKIAIDLDRVRKSWGEVSLGVDIFYERCRELIERSRKVSEDLMASQPGGAIDTLYLTGGGSELPPVARVLRETFGRKVKRSSYMRSATAIGLAIQAEGHAKVALRDQFLKHFGVWREADQGENIVFDLIFRRGTPLPAKSEAPLRVSRSYRPAHNVGHFRYLECTRLDLNGQPEGEIARWDEIRVAFDPALSTLPSLSETTVLRYLPPDAQQIEEEYTCDANGSVKVRIVDHLTGQRQEYPLGKWSKK